MAVEKSNILLGIKSWVAYDNKEIVGVFDSENEAKTELGLHLAIKKLNELKNGNRKKEPTD